MKNKSRSQKICLILTVIMMITTIPVYSIPSHAAYNSKRIRLSEVKSLALSNSADCRKIRTDIASKQVAYQSAVKAIKLKKKKMSTFKWTPLLSFKFPENPTLADEYEFTFKPIQIQSQITSLKHKLTDQVYAVYEETSNLFVQIYTLQESISFDEECLINMNQTLKSNEAKLLLGEASQSDIDKMKSSIKSTEERISTDNRSFQEKKQKLSDLINLDITTGYEFASPYETAEITRTELKTLEDAALNNDQTYYEAKLATQLANIAMNTNYSLMKNQYGSKMSRIDSFVQQAKAGNKIDTDAMKKAYDQLLIDVDKPWTGKKRILFIKIPKEWFKGETSGSRYIEDDPYALYTSILDYQSAYNDELAAKKELISKVDTNFNTMITARNSYLSLLEEVEKEKEGVESNEILNKIGELPYSELKDSQDEYEETQRTALEALDTYTQTLYSYDRLTCGAITALLQGTDIDINPAVGGNSYLIEDMVDGASYYIRSIVEDDAFEIGVSIPEDFSVSITDFEVWVDDTQLIAKTPIKQAARHLTFTKDEYEKVFIRFYDEDKFVDDCEIDPSVYSGPLSIVGGYHLESTSEEVLGQYQTSVDENTGLYQLKLTMDEALGVAYYSIQTEEGKKLLSKDYIPIADAFSYLSVVSGDEKSLVLQLYNENQEFLYQAYLDTSDLAIKKMQTAE